MNNRGFTLIELLITLSISALILIMAIPSITGISNDNRDKEYQEYKESIIYGAKLYYKQRSVDLNWVNKGSNVEEATINFSDLLSLNYVKEFTPTQKEGKKKCDTSPVKVKITKTTKVDPKRPNGEPTIKLDYEVEGLSCGVGNLKEIK